MTPDILFSAGALAILAAGMIAYARAPRWRWAVALSVAGEAATGAGSLIRGYWPFTVATWAAGAYLAVRWVRAGQKARRA